MYTDLLVYGDIDRHVLVGVYSVTMGGGGPVVGYHVSPPKMTSRGIHELEKRFIKIVVKKEMINNLKVYLKNS